MWMSGTSFTFASADGSALPVPTLGKGILHGDGGAERWILYDASINLKPLRVPADVAAKCLDHLGVSRDVRGRESHKAAPQVPDGGVDGKDLIGLVVPPVSLVQPIERA